MAKRTRPAAAGATEAGPTFGAALTPQQIGESERQSTGAGELAIARRATLAVLTRSSAELQAAWATPEGQEALFAAVDMVGEWRDHLKGCAALADAALARLLLTGKTTAAGVKP